MSAFRNSIVDLDWHSENGHFTLDLQNKGPMFHLKWNQLTPAVVRTVLSLSRARQYARQHALEHTLRITQIECSGSAAARKAYGVTLPRLVERLGLLASVAPETRMESICACLVPSCRSPGQWRDLVGCFGPGSSGRIERFGRRAEIQLLDLVGWD